MEGIMGRKEKQREDRYIDRYNAALGVFSKSFILQCCKIVI